jgi:predicted ATPase
MNEQLIVKNFGPIKDATVDFKRVTVFIGPTGGGKSTLAKLAAIFQGGEVELNKTKVSIKSALINYNLLNFKSSNSILKWTKEFGSSFSFDNEDDVIDIIIQEDEHSEDLSDAYFNRLLQEKLNGIDFTSLMKEVSREAQESFKQNLFEQLRQSHIQEVHSEVFYPHTTHYLPTERVFVPAVEYSWAGLMRDDIGLPKLLLAFANNFSQSRKEIGELVIPFLAIEYLHVEGRDLIKIPSREEPLMLSETASGIQSVTPLLVLLEHLSRHTEQAQSFIIEEPELNLYPTAQQGLLNWLVEKCTKGENDLTITTHSPYILSHLNLLLYAYQVVEKHPDRREAVAAIVPEASWINPKEFACYQVENGGVQSLVDEELGLIDNNELDGLSGDAADAFDNLIRLSKGFATK